MYADWERWLTDEMLFSIFVWNKTFLSVVFARYYLLKFPKSFSKFEEKQFLTVFLPEKICPLYVKCVHSSLTLKPY